jgi:lipoprotein-anchoring transpeptidase ErfK/SrfK
VSEAVAAGRGGFFLTRAVRELTGGTVNRDVPLRIGYSHHAVRVLAGRIAKALDQPPRDASVRVDGSALTSVASHRGVAVRTALLRRRIARALVNPVGPRAVPIPALRPPPHVTTSMLAAKYPAYIVVDRSGFTLRYYSHLKLINSYPIAVGMQGLETPGGLYHIQWKQVDPPWYVPNSAWAGSLAGQTIPPGPQDPLKARFMSFDGGAGIHGIDPSEYGTIGHAASHGCIRMTIADVIALYSKTPVGTPVYIV